MWEGGGGGDRGWRECEGHQEEQLNSNGENVDYYCLFLKYKLSRVFLLPCQKTFNLSLDTIRFCEFQILYYYIAYLVQSFFLRFPKSSMGRAEIQIPGHTFSVQQSECTLELLPAACQI